MEAVDEAQAVPNAEGTETSQSDAPKVKLRRSSIDATDQGFIAAVRGSLLLRHLSTAELKYVATNARLATFEPGSVVYEMGAAPDNFYVVQSGRFFETGPHPGGGQRPKRMHEGAGAAFGSHELLFGVPRRTTVSVAREVASDDAPNADKKVLAGRVACWAVPKRVFEAKIRVAPSPDMNLLAFLQKLTLFAKLSKAELVQLVRAARPLSLDPGAMVCTQGEAAHTFYVLQQGLVEAHQAGKAETFAMHAPCIFGEAALFSDEGMRIRQATVRCPVDYLSGEAQSDSTRGESGDGGASATTTSERRLQQSPNGAAAKGCRPCTVLVIAFAAADIEALLGFGLQALAEHAFHQKLLEQIKVGGQPIINTLPAGQKAWLVEQLVERTYAPKEVVCEQGSSADTVFIIKRGVASVGTKEGGKIAELGAGTVLGEMALCDLSTTRNATIIASGKAELKLLCLSGTLVHQTRQLDSWRKALEVVLGAHRKQQDRANKALVLERNPSKQRRPSTAAVWQPGNGGPQRQRRASCGNVLPLPTAPSAAHPTKQAPDQRPTMPRRGSLASVGTVGSAACLSTNTETLKAGRRASVQGLVSAHHAAHSNGRSPSASPTASDSSSFTASSDSSSFASWRSTSPMPASLGPMTPPQQAHNRHATNSASISVCGSGSSGAGASSFRREGSGGARSCVGQSTSSMAWTPPTPAQLQFPLGNSRECSSSEVAELKDLFAKGPPSARRQASHAIRRANCASE